MASTPKHYAQKLRLLEVLDSSQPGDPLPTERELAERFGTSRTTIRQALSALESEGRILREQGRGTFVAPAPVIHVRPLTSLSEDMTDGAARSRVLAITECVADPETAALLELPSADGHEPLVTRIERVRLRGDVALAHEVAYLPGAYPEIARALRDHGSLYATLRDVYGVALTAVEDEVGTALAEPADAERLGIAVGFPLLIVRRVARSADGTPRECTRSRFRGDLVRFVAHSQHP